MITEKTVSSHSTVRVGEDVIIQSFGHSPTREDMIATIQMHRELMGDKPFYLCIDLTNVTAMSPEARKVIGDGAKTLNLRAIGIYGAGFQMKIMAKLINGAIALFKGQDMPQQFFDTREQVLAWFDTLRRSNGAKGS